MTIMTQIRREREQRQAVDQAVNQAVNAFARNVVESYLERGTGSTDAMAYTAGYFNSMLVRALCHVPAEVRRSMIDQLMNHKVSVI